MAFPKVAGPALVALLLMATIAASSYGEVSRKEVKLATPKIFIDEEDGVVSAGKPHIEQVTTNQHRLKCQKSGSFCNTVVGFNCCDPLFCHEIRPGGGWCV